MPAAVNPQSPDLLLSSAEAAQVWWAEHMTDALEDDTTTRENGEHAPTTLTA